MEERITPKAPRTRSQARSEENPRKSKTRESSPDVVNNTAQEPSFSQVVRLGSQSPPPGQQTDDLDETVRLRLIPGVSKAIHKGGKSASRVNEGASHPINQKGGDGSRMPAARTAINKGGSASKKPTSPHNKASATPKKVPTAQVSPVKATGAAVTKGRQLPKGDKRERQELATTPVPPKKRALSKAKSKSDMEEDLPVPKADAKGKGKVIRTATMPKPYIKYLVAENESGQARDEGAGGPNTQRAVAEGRVITSKLHRTSTSLKQLQNDFQAAQALQEQEARAASEAESEGPAEEGPDLAEDMEDPDALTEIWLQKTKAIHEAIEGESKRLQGGFISFETGVSILELMYNIIDFGTGCSGALRRKLLIDEFTEHLEGLLRIGYEIHPSTVPREDLMSIEVSDLMVSLSELGRDEWEEWLGQTLKAGASYRRAMEIVDRFKPAPAAPVAAPRDRESTPPAPCKIYDMLRACEAKPSLPAAPAAPADKAPAPITVAAARAAETPATLPYKAARVPANTAYVRGLRAQFFPSPAPDLEAEEPTHEAQLFQSAVLTSAQHSPAPAVSPQCN